MTNFSNYEATSQEFNLADHVVEPEYFLDRVRYFEDKFREQFPKGWNEFYAAYSLGITDKGVLDYDEWAFLCQQFMGELTQPWQPPGELPNTREKPEMVSGFSFGRKIRCLIRNNTSEVSRENSMAAKAGQTLMVLN